MKAASRQSPEAATLISRTAARNLLLAAQRLLSPPVARASKPRMLAAVRRMGLLQIDSISVVARSQYLVLWSRLGHYPTRWLDELHAQGALFEYWAHAACYLPSEDYRIYRRRMLEWTARERADGAGNEVRERVLARVRAQGEMKAVEFERALDHPKGTWWNWTPEKVALERLFRMGALMISRRAGFNRVYAPSERIVPEWSDEHTLSRAQGERELTLRALLALGVAIPTWVVAYFPDYLRGGSALQRIARLLKTLAEEELAIPVRIEGIREMAYVHQDYRRWLQQAARGGLRSSVTTLLSPFDPVISDRNRTHRLFNFHYRIEVYTPLKRRKYGYFSLPILHRGRLVGRLDAKAHRKARTFEVRSLHLENGVTGEKLLRTQLAAALVRCSKWHDTPRVLFADSVVSRFGKSVRASLARLQGGKV
jgi:uncharacterized protein YcaQ